MCRDLTFLLFKFDTLINDLSFLRNRYQHPLVSSQCLSTKLRHWSSQSFSQFIRPNNFKLTQRVFAPFQGGGILRAHHGLVLFYFLQLLPSLWNNPLFPHTIQVLKNPVSLLTLYLLNSYCIFLQKVSLGWDLHCVLATCSAVPPPLTQRRVHCPVLSHGRCHCKELSPPFQGEGSWQHKIDWWVLFFSATCSVY